jgi:hypothetical protein
MLMPLGLTVLTTLLILACKTVVCNNNNTVRVIYHLYIEGCMCTIRLNLCSVIYSPRLHIKMEKFAVDLDKVLDEFEFNEGQFQL